MAEPGRVPVTVDTDTYPDPTTYLARLEAVLYDDPGLSPRAPRPDFRGAVEAARAILDEWRFVSAELPAGAGEWETLSADQRDLVRALGDRTPVRLPTPVLRPGPGPDGMVGTWSSMAVTFPRGVLYRDPVAFAHDPTTLQPGEPHRTCWTNPRGWVTEDSAGLALVCDLLHPAYGDSYVNVWTDGACTTGGLGGWAWWCGDRPGEHDSGAEPFTTNNQMEMWAVIEAIGADYDHEPIRIISDSKYVVDCMTERWYDRWRANGWRKETRTEGGTGWQPVANRELWEELLATVEGHAAPIDWVHVRGHGKDKAADPVLVAGNKAADRLAVEARIGLAAQHDHRGERT